MSEERERFEAMFPNEREMKLKRIQLDKNTVVFVLPRVDQKRVIDKFKHRKARTFNYEYFKGYGKTNSIHIGNSGDHDW